MKKKSYMTMVYTVGLCLLMACSVDIDTTTAHSARNFNTGITESEHQFFRNQEKSLNILDEAMSPFRKGFDEATGMPVYNESFAGVFIDENGHLNIGIIQDSITEQTEISMNRLRGQVIYRQDDYSYNFLLKKMEVISEAAYDFGIHRVSLREDQNRLYIYLFDINRAGDIKNLFHVQGAFDENAIVFIDDPKNILFFQQAYSGEGITRTTSGTGTIGVNAYDNTTGRIGVITNEHVARLGDTMIHGGSIIGPVLKAQLGGDVDASFIPFQNQNEWNMTPNARNSGITHTNIRLGNESQIVNGRSIMKIGLTTGTAFGTIRSANTRTIMDNPHGSGRITINNTIELNIANALGDSGGPVYFNDTQTDTLWLIGIHFAGNGSPGTIGSACRISNVMSVLNVTPITNDTYQFTNVGDNVRVDGLNIARIDYPVGRLTIPSQFNGINVTQLGVSAFSGRTGITSVTLPNTLQNIGWGSFASTSISNIIIPTTVTRIEENAFLNTGIWNNTPDNSVVYADKWAIGYKGNTANIVSIRPDTIGIGDFAFNQKNVLNSVNLPFATIIGNNAFYYCTNLVSVNLPSATIIGENAFSNCTNLESINLPVATTINTYAFYYCTSLVSVNFPEATSIGYGAFNLCTSLESVDFPKATNIIYGAFSNCSSLESVNLPLAASIGYGAFSYCYSLESIYLPAATSIGLYAFYYSNNLESVDLPLATSIGTDAFMGCSSLTSVKLPKAPNTSNIPVSQLKHLTIGQTSIGSNTFANRIKLISLDFPEAISIGSNAFTGSSNLISLKIPKVTSASNIPLNQLEHLTIGLTSVENSAFANLTNLISLDLPEATITYHYAFSGCTNLTSINLPKVFAIGPYSFSGTGTQALTVTLRDTAPAVGNFLFDNIHSPKNVIVRIPDGATGYGTIPFNNADTNTVNWGNGFRGRGWMPPGSPPGTVNPNIDLTFASI
ncbi:MAG: leucine-rich repeat protein [Treponema sp.]|nr:leucine-rich repeat protein [Treponema sp.]